MNTKLLDKPAIPASAGGLPDVNVETYPFDVVQEYLDRAAFLNLFAVPDRNYSERINRDAPEDWYGINGGYVLDICSELCRFDATIDTPGSVTQCIGTKFGKLHLRMTIAPEATDWSPGSEPAPRVFDPWRSQRFVSAELMLELGDKDHGFRGYSLGRTYPLTIDGRPQVVLCLVGNLCAGFGNLAGFEGTLCLQGSLTPDLGFQGNVTCRIVDPNEQLKPNRDSVSPFKSLGSQRERELFDSDGATYIAMRGEKTNRSVRTEYGSPPGPGLVSLVTPADMHAVRYALLAQPGKRIQSEMHVGCLVAKLKATVALDILAPPGTPESPNNFNTNNIYTFIDGSGHTIGTVTAVVETGKSFDLKFPDAPGQPGMRYGGFGPIVRGTGLFEGVTGSLVVNSAIGVAPHVLSMLNVLRIIDPNGGLRRKASGTPTRRQKPRIVFSGRAAAAETAKTQSRPESLPDINAETYPFETVQRLLDQAAHFHMYSRGGEQKRGAAIHSNGEIIGFTIKEDLRRFIVRVDAPTQHRGIKALNDIAERVAMASQRWVLIPEDYAALPGRRPPTTSLDASISQRFVMLDTEFRFGTGEHGFHGFGTGRTYPSTFDGRRELLAGAVGTITRGFGDFQGLEGTYTYCGTVSPNDGFVGSVFLRVVDPENRLAATTPFSESHSTSSPEPGVKYLVFRGQKKDRTQKTNYKFASDGTYQGLTLHPQIRLFESDFRAGSRMASTYSVGDVVGHLDALVLFNPLEPGAPGTALSPIPFHDYDDYIFKDRQGNVAGGFGFDGGAGALVGHPASYEGEGRVFSLALPSAPEQQAVRFGGFGQTVNSRGIFGGARGIVAHNSVVGIAPHVLSTVFVARIRNAKP